MKKKHVLILLSIIAIAAVGLFIYFYKSSSIKIGYFKGNTKEFFVTENLEKEQLVEMLLHDSIIENKSELNAAFQLKKFKNAKPGRYVVKKGMSGLDFVSNLRSGNQTPMMVKVDGVRTIYQLASKLDQQLMYDSTAFLDAMLDSKLFEKYGLNEFSASALIFPNTYEYFWTITPAEFISKMEDQYNAYWSDENKEAAKKLGMSPAEVATLASIVKGETVNKAEAPKIAGLYLNRLRKGMKLEADPTITFASNLKNVSRVKLDPNRAYSPYDTYKNFGLPPGPIFFTEEVYLDAVLHAENHNYLFMCAQPKGTGFHDFTTNFEAHKVYAKAYRKWLNSINVR